MGKFDLNNAADFARMTNSSLAGIAGVLDTAFGSKTKWDIQEASINGVKFHIFKSAADYNAGLSSVQDSGGRRKVKYLYPYRDGQTTDDLGRKPETFSFDIVIHGPKYKNNYLRLIKELQQPAPVKLIHPVRGEIQCVCEEYTLTHQSDQRNAVTISLTMIEHNFDVGKLSEQKDKTVRGALARALDAFKKIDAIITNVTGAVGFVTSLKTQITQQLQEFQYRFQKNLTNMNVTFNGGGAEDFPSLLPVNLGGNQTQTGDQAGDTFNTIASPSDPFLSTPDLSTTTALAIAVEQLKKDVNTNRQLTKDLIDLMSDANNGQGSLVFYSDILDIKQSLVQEQECLETGIATSNARLIDYAVPRLMTIREVAFANGFPLDRVNEIEQLNTELESVNYIAKGTTVRVPVA